MAISTICPSVFFFTFYDYEPYSFKTTFLEKEHKTPNQPQVAKQRVFKAA